MRAVFALLLLCAYLATDAQTISRGPYLNVGTPTSMIVRWRTDVAVKGKVLYGTDLNNIATPATETSSTTEHIVTITGLKAATKYYYTITDANDNTYQGADSLRYFQTSPVPGTRQPITIWALGDFGNGSAGQIGTRNGFEFHTNNQHTDAWIWLGDNAYGDGTDQQFQDYVFDVYPDQFKNTVVWPAPGNHDYKSINLLTHDGPYYQNFSFPENGEAGGRPSGEAGYYSFDYGNVHLISLNSEYVVWFLTSSSKMVDWLKKDLQQNDKDFTIVYFHKPPYSKASHDSDSETDMALIRSVINPVLEEYGVDLVLNGHSHAYERSYLMKGHFGDSASFNSSYIVDSSKGSPNPFVKYYDAPDANQGTIYAVVGCGGQLSCSGSLAHPAHYYTTCATNGSLVINVDSNLLTARLVDTAGVVRDEFKILKQFLADTISSVPTLRALDNEVSIYPNPANKNLSVSISTTDNGFYLVEIMDTEGRVLLGRHIKAMGNATETLDVSHLASGSYFVRVSQEGAKDLVQRVVVAH